MNVPVEESFVRDSPYVLEGAPADGYRVRDERTGHRYADHDPVGACVVRARRRRAASR